MTEKVELNNLQLQKVTLLVSMHDYDKSDLDAGEWLFNVLSICSDPTNQAGHHGAKAFFKSAKLLGVQNCDVVVSNGL
jgi:hypothetical protein